MNGHNEDSASAIAKIVLGLLLCTVCSVPARASHVAQPPSAGITAEGGGATCDLYVVDVAGALGRVDVPSGAVTVIGNMGVILTDIAFDLQGRLWGVSLDRFYRVDPNTGAVTDLGPHGVPSASSLGVDANGTIYAAGYGDTWLYAIDPYSARATPLRDIGRMALGDLVSLDGKLYMATTDNNLLRIDPARGGSTAVVGPVGLSNLYGMGVINGILYGAAGTSIYTIDPGTGHTTWVCDYAGHGLQTAWGAAAMYRATTETPRGVTTNMGFGQYYDPCEPQITADARGYSLPLDPNRIVNWDTVGSFMKLGDVSDLIRQNGFAVVEPASASDDIVSLYSTLHDQQIPTFVTADTVLHLYHVQFDSTLMQIEQQWFIPDISDLTAALLEQSVRLYYSPLNDTLKEAAKRNVAYFALAQQLVAPDAVAPAFVAMQVADEVAKINAHQGFAPSDIFIYQEDYSQYVPRGHYTQSEALQRYFKVMMWYGRMAFLLKGSNPSGPATDALVSAADAKIQTVQAMLLAGALRDVQVGDRKALDVWNRIYAVTSFYVGTADDLTPYDYLWALDQVFAGSYALNDLSLDNNYLAIKRALASLPKPQIYGGTGEIIAPPDASAATLDQLLDETAGLRLMGQRFIPDSYMFQNLVCPAVGGYTGPLASLPFTMDSTGARGYPRGLDAMALLGSEQAKRILADEGDTCFADYEQQFAKLKDQFDALSTGDWNANLYWSWLYSLRAMLTPTPQGYPNFMQTAAWQQHQLHSALASWTELRHDTILYAKQSYTTSGASRGSTKTPPPPPPGYVEPLPALWGRLAALTHMTIAGLGDFQVFSASTGNTHADPTPLDQARTRLVGLQDLLNRMLKITQGELLNQPLSASDADYIRNLPGTLQSLVVAVAPDDFKTTLVADVHTDGNDGMVLEEAVGKVDWIVVACPAADGSVFLAVGPVLSYYEFKHPMNDRLTDEAWRILLDSPSKPPSPDWYRPTAKTK